MADRVKSQEAADIGTLLHAYAELHSRGQFAECGELQVKARGLEQWPAIESCILKYLAWASENKGELVVAEGLVASPTYAYCGKFDLLSRRDGRLILSDYKTSKAIFAEQKIQLAAYRLAITEWLGLDVAAIEILRFGKTGGEFETCLVDDPVELAVYTNQAIRCRLTYGFVKANDA